jgi:ABC-type nickel/cobalt efflux system permease component RcnA
MIASTRRWVTRSAAAGVAVSIGVLLLGATGAQAHPLGNFSVNHSHNLTVSPDGIVDRAILDFAEIPTAQAHDSVDLDGDGQVSADELAARGRAGCDALASAITLRIDGAPTALALAESSFGYHEGQAGLETSRLECRFESAGDLSVAREIALRDDFESDRVGWHEINALGDGIVLIDSPVPAISTTDELRTYPDDLLASPLNVRDLTVRTVPGAAPAPATVVAPRTDSSPSILHGGPFASVVDRISGTFDDLVGRRDLTLGVGLLAVALAMVLGASHALLPGHGKTVMAAYIAGRQGSTRDAVVVGATVTATHTGGVLLLGLALTVSSSLTGESVLGWLGIVSGSIIAVLGLGLLRSARRHELPAHGHRHTLGSHHHDHSDHYHDNHHDNHHHDNHDHGHDGPHRHTSPAEPASLPGSLLVRDRRALALSVKVPTARPPIVSPTSAAAADLAPPAPIAVRPVSRRGLIGMGIAGGLVPSPSALIVLLSAIALGRTAFGVLLVIGYGLGMAATLTLAGLLLVRVRDRLQHRPAGSWSRTSSLARRWTVAAPYVMAVFVLVVGIGIAVRGSGAV